ncbi:MAG: class I SAM-dependent methyltransferase, partial [Alphaproteobacteria bacterium]
MARLLDKTDGIFFTRWLRNPRTTASIVPSGAALVRLMARQIDPRRPGIVVELGAGTGVITAALLAAGLPVERLIVVERDEVLHRLLQKRFPELLVIRDDAANLGAQLRERGIERVAAVVSSLPFLAMGERAQCAVLAESRALLDDSGAFVQYTYGPKSPVRREKLAEWGWQATRLGTAWLNLPPAVVWRFTKRPVEKAG